MSWIFFTLSATAGAAAPAFYFDGWPGEGRPVFTARSEVELPLRSAPDPDAPTQATCRLPAGRTLEWDQSRQVATHPLSVHLDAPIVLRGMSWGPVDSLDRTTYYTKGREVRFELLRGESIDLLMVRAEASCFMRVRGQLVEAGCFDVPGLESTDAIGDAWWVHVRCGEAHGWLQPLEYADALEQRRAF